MDSLVRFARFGRCWGGRHHRIDTVQTAPVDRMLSDARMTDQQEVDTSHIDNALSAFQGLRAQRNSAIRVTVSVRPKLARAQPTPSLARAWLGVHTARCAIPSLLTSVAMLGVTPQLAHREGDRRRLALNASYTTRCALSKQATDSPRSSPQSSPESVIFTADVGLSCGPVGSDSI